VRRLTDHVSCQLDVGAEQLAQPLGGRGEAVLRVGQALRTAQVGQYHDLRAGLDQTGQRRKRGANAPVVGDDVAVERDIEITANQDALTSERAKVGY